MLAKHREGEFDKIHQNLFEIKTEISETMTDLKSFNNQQIALIMNFSTYPQP
jgi:hypothetical protein